LRAAIAAVWAVVLSTFFLQAGNGLQTDLIGVRADIEAFPSGVIGLMMAAYYVGYSLAPLAGRAVIGFGGHVRTIAFCAVAAAAVISVHPFAVTPPAWAAFRFVSGFLLSLSYVGYESWINDSVPNALRGRVFGLYMFAQMVAMTAAQGLFQLGEATSVLPFLLAGGLFVLAAVPVAAAHRAAPAAAPPAPLGILKLFRLSPLGAGSVVLAGLSWAIVFTFGPIYARHAGFDASGVALFMGLAMAAGAALQLPLGWLSDVAGRRPVIALVFAAGLVASLLGLWAEGAIPNLIAIALAGGFVFPIYAIAVAHVNDGIAADTRVAAAAGLVLLFGIGSIFGPLLCGWAMGAMGNAGFYALLSAATAAGVGLVLLTWQSRAAKSPAL
jgi:MFS family permease